MFTEKGLGMRRWLATTSRRRIYGTGTPSAPASPVTLKAKVVRASLSIVRRLRGLTPGTRSKILLVRQD
jgi:hypothetical protein